MEQDWVQKEQEKQFDELVEILQGMNRLKTIDLQQLLKNLESENLKDEFSKSLFRLLRRFGNEFHRALEKAGIENPISHLKVKSEEELKAEEEQKLAEVEQKKESEEAHQVPMGYEKWTMRDFIKHEDKVIAFWAISGAYGTGEIQTHDKLKEFYLKPVRGEPIVLTQGRKNRLAPGATQYYFKLTKRVF